MEESALRQNWGWLLALGILLVILGIIALGSLVVTSIVTVSIFGWLLFIAGVAQIILLFGPHAREDFALHLLSGILGITVGLLIAFNPGAGSVVLTFVLSFYFIVSGIFRLITSLVRHGPNWGWPFAYGIIAFLLGILILTNLPVSGLVIIGLFVGIELIFNGFSWIALALAAHEQPE